MKYICNDCQTEKSGFLKVSMKYSEEHGKVVSTSDGVIISCDKCGKAMSSKPTGGIITVPPAMRIAGMSRVEKKAYLKKRSKDHSKKHGAEAKRVMDLDHIKK